MAAAFDSVSSVLAVGQIDTVTPPIPNTTADIVGILPLIARADLQTISVNSDDGSWPDAGHNNVDVGSNTISVRYRRMTGGDSDPVCTQTGANGLYGIIACFSGVITTGSPVHQIAASTPANASTHTAPEVTTTEDGCLILRIFIAQDDTNWINAVESIATAVEIAAGANYITATGSDGSMGMSYYLQSSAGVTGTCTMDLDVSGTPTAEVGEAITIALLPQPAAGGGVQPIVLQDVLRGFSGHYISRLGGALQ